jgi:hypothetical protein
MLTASSTSESIRRSGRWFYFWFTGRRLRGRNGEVLD